MSRYTILLLLNTPFVLAGLLNATVAYKLGRTSIRRFIVQVITWAIVFIGLALAETIYEFLFSNNLTRTEPLSLFDVIQITGIVAVLYIANRTRSKVEVLERRVQDLHQELSIRLSDNNRKH